jgi:hypothetical protein
MGPSDKPMDNDGSPNHGMSKLAASLIITDENPVTGIPPLIIVHVMLFELSNEV